MRRITFLASPESAPPFLLFLVFVSLFLGVPFLFHSPGKKYINKYIYIYMPSLRISEAPNSPAKLGDLGGSSGAGPSGGPGAAALCGGHEGRGGGGRGATFYERFLFCRGRRSFVFFFFFPPGLVRGFKNKKINLVALQRNQRKRSAQWCPVLFFFFFWGGWL